MMKKYLIAVALLAGCATTSTEQAPVRTSRPGPGPTQDELRNDGKNTDNVLTYGMGYHQQRYSPLNQINKGNVKRLVPVWSLSLQNEFGEQAQPLVYNGVIYVSNAKWTVAIDAVTGKQVWRTPVDFVPETPRVVCCGVSNKGVALYNGKVFRTTLDAHVVALDQQTGKVIWKQKAAEWKEGYSMTAAPLIANGVLITGISGAEFGIRGFIDGWDPDTGKRLWRRYTTAGPGDKGHETWEPRESYRTGGASTWITGSYDPELDLMYWGTGNAGPWNAEFRKGDNLYVASVLALRPKTGEIVWHYQFTPNDPYDYDAVNELVHASLMVKGVRTKVIMQANKNGFFYVIDRTNGKLLAANQFAKKVNWADRIDLASGRPVESELTKKFRAGEKIEVWPSALGGKNWMPMSFNPKTGLAYANTLDFGMPYKLLTPEYKQGEWFLGVEFTGVTPAKGVRGSLQAIDPMTGKAKWEMPWEEMPSLSGTLTTAGGLVFTGAMSGEFMALDADSGKKLWQFQTGSGIIGQPVTWEHKGRQYVTVVSGVGGVYALIGDERLAKVPAGGSVWTFALMK